MYLGTGVTAVVFYAALILFAVYLRWRWIRWWKRTPRLQPPKWRAIVAAIAFLAGTASFALSVGLAVYSSVSGGLRFYHPVLVCFGRLGFLLSVSGLCLTILGKGQLRVPGLVSNLLTLAFWCVLGGLQ